MCDPGGPGGGLKIEPMDTSSPNDPSPESLNRDGLQVTKQFIVESVGGSSHINKSKACLESCQKKCLGKRVIRDNRANAKK